MKERDEIAESLKHDIANCSEPSHAGVHNRTLRYLAVCEGKAKILANRLIAAFGAYDDEIHARSVECLTLLINDPDWRESRKDTETGKLRLWLATSELAQRYVDLALKMRGDQPAMALNFNEIVADAWGLVHAEVRAIVTDWMIEVGILEKGDRF